MRANVKRKTRFIYTEKGLRRVKPLKVKTKNY